jgi:S-adenosylmethionine:tRNA ribosyltransferase-isomerase
LPPYIKRDNKDIGLSDYDRSRYQTVFARREGAVAAPTAGLHFTDRLFEDIRDKGIQTAFVTLHVGAGTFRPVKTENLEDHDIHSEYYSIDSENAAIINKAHQNGGRIIAVGTTSVRTLETVADSKGQINPSRGNTKLFIQPGYEFKIVDGMITNFHLPKSTLLALVSAFTGTDNVISAYRHAVEQRYRFYSYGDAMFII